MTSHGIYAVYDRKAQYFLPLFSSPTDAEAVRTFTGVVTSSDTPISQYPADFDLCRVGTVDVQAGTITAPVRPDPLVNGLVALEDAHRERRRYQAILETSPEAAS